MPGDPVTATIWFCERGVQATQGVGTLHQPVLVHMKGFLHTAEVNLQGECLDNLTLVKGVTSDPCSTSDVYESRCTIY